MKTKIQKILGVKQDGDIGPDTLNAFIQRFNIPISADTAAVRVQKFLGLVPDGKIGPKTIEAMGKKLNIAVSWPRDRESEMNAFYGPVGKNMTTLVLPYPMVLSWEPETKVTKITCHEKVHDSLKRIFQKTLDHYGLDKIKEMKLDRFAGCLYVRPKRNGTTWSVHAWGAAVDLAPEQNELKWDHKRALFAKPDYKAFWDIVEGEGWTSLGRSRDYDWQHFQAAGL